ncbi:MULTISPECIES: hypothetical protein [unclassified Halorubrum]|uniref:DUF7521 family protein n=1 Tax=unclassified Halorubrum TaxID=2642239 RepID=UPI000B984DCE|nr:MULTISPECIES: hypothetical protein [unclassified Halorubrum]OYR48019.1 hypothetical protein DJ81_00100 [Halorubrum sp. Hd13]OYR48952.1 hypothetical protein DJ74_09535 [Halorubrum sp. Ea8]
MTLEPVGLQELSGIDWLLLSGEILITVLGLSISYIAYVGYRRSDSRPMLLFCIGFILVIGVPAIVGSAVVFADRIKDPIAGAVTQLSTILGMVLILIALRTSG